MTFPHTFANLAGPIPLLYLDDNFNSILPQYPFLDVRQFGAVGDGVTDDTAAIQAALASGHNVYCPPGQYLISGMLQVYDNKLWGAGSAHTIFITAMAVGVYAAISLGKLGWTTGSDTTRGGYVGGIQISRKANTPYVIGLLVTGAHNATVEDMMTVSMLIGCYVENTSELCMSQFVSVTDIWSFVFDNRYTRTAAQRPGGFTATGNDVSSCKLNMLTSSFSQQNGVLLMNCGTMNFTGMTMNAFSANPSSVIGDMPYGFPISRYGMYFYGDPNGNSVRNSNVTGVVFEAAVVQGAARTCIKIYSPTVNTAPVDNITFTSCEVQTYTAYIFNNDCTTFMELDGNNANISVSVNDCGFSYNASSTNVYYTGKLFYMVGQSNIIANNVYPLTALSISTLTQGFKYRSLGVNILYEMPIYGLTAGAGNIPAGWTGKGAFATNLVKADSGATTPASLNFVGGSGLAGMWKTFSFDPYMFDPKNIVIIMQYTGDEPSFDLNVNSQNDTLLSIKTGVNPARYGNTLYCTPDYMPNTNTTKLRVISFPEFNAVTAFKILYFELTINSLVGTLSSNLQYFAVGYIPGYARNNMYS